MVPRLAVRFLRDYVVTSRAPGVLQDNALGRSIAFSAKKAGILAAGIDRGQLGTCTRAAFHDLTDASNSHRARFMLSLRWRCKLEFGTVGAAGE